MSLISRDDLHSLQMRKHGGSIVCATVYSANPLEIRDKTGRMLIQKLPTGESLLPNDTYLFHFECFPAQTPDLKKVTLIPEELAPLYDHLLMEFRRSMNMGVAWVFEHQGNTQVIEALLLAHGAETIGPYSVDCLPYNPAQSVGGGQCYVLHHSQYPQTSFAISPTESLKTSPKATCDRGFDLILSKMSSGLTPDIQAKFECHGQEFRLRDFVVRLGTAIQVTTVKGVIIEVEYEPSMLAVQALPMLLDFMNLFFPNYVSENESSQRPEAINKSIPEIYTTLDTIFQYLLIFRNMRARTLPNAPA